MSLKPQAIPPVPEETKRIAQAAFPKGNIYLQMRDQLGGMGNVEHRCGALGVSVSEAV